MCQPGRPMPQGDSQAGSPGLAAFQTAKSRGSALPGSVSTRTPSSSSSMRCPLELAVLVEAAHLEVHAAVRLVGVPAGDELADEVDDLRDRLGGLGLDVRPRDAQPVGVLDVGGGVLLRHRRRVAALVVRLVDDLVVDVGDVGHQRDVEAPVREPRAQDGEGDVGARVADVHQVVDRGAAAVDAGLAGVAGLERLLLLGQRVEEADHGWSPGSSWAHRQGSRGGRGRVAPARSRGRARRARTAAQARARRT